MRNPRRIAGWAVIAVGGAAILIGVSPLFPVFLEAFLVGGALIGTGLWLLGGKDLRTLLGRGKEDTRRRTGPGSGTARAHGPVVIDPLLPVRILKLAKARQGMLTVSEAAMELSVPLDHAEAGLEACVRAGNAVPDWDVARGYMLYRFPEFAPREQ
jgi:hypothetical protein